MASKDKGAPAHSVSHTDIAKGQGGGQMTQDGIGGGGGNADEHAKNRDWREPGNPGLGGADAEDTARRKENTGKDLGFGKG